MLNQKNSTKNVSMSSNSKSSNTSASSNDASDPKESSSASATSSGPGGNILIPSMLNQSHVQPRSHSVFGVMLRENSGENSAEVSIPEEGSAQRLKSGGLNLGDMSTSGGEGETSGDGVVDSSEQE